MRDQFYSTLFTDSVLARQEDEGMREKYAQIAALPCRHELGVEERQFIETRTSFYLATISQSGWPYMQHRGGPAGFLKVIDNKTLGMPDYPGNQQYITAGNTDTEDRVSLFFIDYPRRGRLKMLARARFWLRDEAPDLAETLTQSGAPGTDRFVTFEIDSFDWNCPQYITPRFDEAEIQQMIGPRLTEMNDYIAALEQKLTTLDPNWKAK
ncbi:MAG: pyridoxamine 5'-phosphate oxidase family protein [Litoreibacter sp.]